MAWTLHDFVGPRAIANGIQRTTLGPMVSVCPPQAEDGCSRSGSTHVSFKYIQPCSPVTAKSVPAGDDW
jgi:hypothetical protein